MSQAKRQFERVGRAFQGVLNNRNRNLVEYEDDTWSFILNCWHFKDWIKNDVGGVAKATRGKIEVEVNSYPALMIIGDLANRSKHLQVSSSVSDAGEVLVQVTEKNGEEIPIKKLATDAMKNWMAIVKKYRI